MAHVKSRPKKDANESPQQQAGGISTLRKAKGQPNQAKSHPGSGRPLGPPTPRPTPPPGRGAAPPSRPGLPNPPRATGSGSVEPPINTAARIRAAGGGAGTVPPEKVGRSAEEATAGIAGRTKEDDVKPGEKTPLPPAPPEEGAAPVDPASGLPREPNADGSFTDEAGNALDETGKPAVNPDTGAPMTPEQALSQDIKAESGATSNFLSDREARDIKETARRAAPSEIQGVNQGHFEDVTSDEKFKNYGGKDVSPMKRQEIQENVKAQLAEYGSFPGQDDPKAPAPPIREMGRSFNPFTGRFTGEGGRKNFSHVKGFDFEVSKREFYKNGGAADLPTASTGSGGVTADSLNAGDGDDG